MKRHLKRKHPKDHEEYDQQQTNKKRKTEQSGSLQPKIASFMKASPILEFAVDLIVENAVAFELFGSTAMRSLYSFAKKGCGDSSSRVIDAETVKQAL